MNLNVLSEPGFSLINFLIPFYHNVTLRPCPNLKA